MKNRNSKLAIGMAIIMEIILICGVIFNIVLKQWGYIYLYCIASVCIILPFVLTKIANIKEIMLPHSFQFAFLVFILLANYLGEIIQLYTKFWWWDLFLHGIFGSYAVIIGLHLTEDIIIKPKEITEKRFGIFRLVFAFCFTITLGTVWEILEFLGDYFFKTDMVNGGIEDTATDLLIKMLGAFITLTIYYYKKIKAHENK